MSTSAIVGEEIDKQAAQATAAFEGVSSARQMLPRAALDVLGPYSAALYIAARVVESDVFDAELVQSVHSKLLPLEQMADGALSSARQRGDFNDPEVAVPLHWLETCNEQMKDCLVALEAMLDPQLNDLMERAIEEHQAGRTVSLESIR